MSSDKQPTKAEQCPTCGSRLQDARGQVWPNGTSGAGKWPENCKDVWHSSPSKPADQLEQWPKTGDFEGCGRCANCSSNKPEYLFPCGDYYCWHCHENRGRHSDCEKCLNAAARYFAQSSGTVSPIGRSASEQDGVSASTVTTSTTAELVPPIKSVEYSQSSADLGAGVEKARHITELLTPHIRHQRDCCYNLPDTNPSSDFCDCGLKKHREEATKLLNELASFAAEQKERDCRAMCRFCRAGNVPRQGYLDNQSWWHDYDAEANDSSKGVNAEFHESCAASAIRRQGEGK
jgi:hypothetical protein